MTTINGAAAAANNGYGMQLVSGQQQPMQYGSGAAQQQQHQQHHQQQQQQQAGGQQNGQQGQQQVGNASGANPAQVQADLIAESLVSFFSHEYDAVDSAVQYLLRKNGRNPIGYRVGGGAGATADGGGGRYNQQQGGDARQQQHGNRQGGGRHQNSGGGRNGAPVANQSGNWQCDESHCGNINFPYRTACNRCAKERTGGSGLANQVIGNANNNGENSQGRNGMMDLSVTSGGGGGGDDEGTY
jgi:hypothetical protein